MQQARTRAGLRLTLPRVATEAWITLGLFVLLIAVVLASGSGDEEPRVRYDPSDAGSEGLLALRLWLEEMGYQVETMSAAFRIPPGADMLIVYPNRTPYLSEEADALTRWVRQGHTLVLVGPDSADTALIEAFGVRSEELPELNPGLELRQRQPLLPDAPASLGELGFEPALNLDAAPAAVPVVATDEGHVTAAVQSVGRGTVWHLSSRHDFTNGDLQENLDAGVIVPVLLRDVPAGGQIVFDTYHLFEADVAAQPQNASLRGWLYGTPVGRALLFAVGVVFVYFALQGIRLGPPLPTHSETRRREAAEYVTAIASLQRRAGHHRSIADHHKQRLKRTLGGPRHVDPTLDDDEFVRRLQIVDEQLGKEQLDRIRRLLVALSADPAEARLVGLVTEVDEVEQL